MKVIGISAYFHDSSAALVIDGKVVAAAQEERFTRLKHDSGLPVQAVRFCLEQAGLTIDEIDYIVFYEKPLQRFERLLVTHLAEFPKGSAQFVSSMGRWLSRRLWMKNEWVKALGCRADQILCAEHHLSHAAAAFLSSPYQTAAIVTADGVGEWTTTSIYRGVTDANGSRIEKLQELTFPHSIGLLYAAITAYLGFEVNEGEYKVMGLASYGAPVYLDKFEKLCKVNDDASLVLDMQYFCYNWHATNAFTPALEALLGPARKPHAKLSLPAETSEDRRFSDIAASLQKFTEAYMLKLVQHAKELTGEKNLTLAGGVALNCVANLKILSEGPVESIYVQSAAGDAGGALGAALYMTHVIAGLPRQPALNHAFLGAAVERSEVVRFLSDCGVPFKEFASTTEMCRAVVDCLMDGEVGGWVQGRFEHGPRALGARSIIADPRRADMRERVNRKIKYREGFRPFAPACLAEDLKEWFILPEGREEHMTPFMCCVANVSEHGKRVLPATTHIDGTARVQRVEASHNPVFHELLTRFKERSGVGVLLNTSLNLKDEPICNSHGEAFATFMRSEMDFLVVENCLVRKEDCQRLSRDESGSDREVMMAQRS
jgi:carbamoyltransferase